jgi:nucleoside-diphosphate-sugar epimerase
MNPMKKESILITGSRGFVGSHLFNSLLSKNYNLIPVQRISSTEVQENLAPAKTAIHLAGLAHQTKGKSQESIYMESNLHLTEDFLKKAIQAGVEHFIYFSTIKVLGEGQKDPYSETSNPNPQDSYARSKLEAEESLKRISAENRIAYTILRPPLIYGNHPKANLESLINWVAKGRPVPISSKVNQRSIISLDNLTEFLQALIQNSLSNNQTFLVQDSTPVSTKQMVIWIAEALKKNPHFLTIPNSLAEFSFGLIGQSAKWKRFSESLYVDDGYTRKVLNWKPKISSQDGFHSMVASMFKI